MQEWMLHDALFIVPKYTKITDLICLPNSSDSIHIKSPIIPGIPSIIHYPHQILSFFSAAASHLLLCTTLERSLPRCICGPGGWSRCGSEGLVRFPAGKLGPTKPPRPSHPWERGATWWSNSGLGCLDWLRWLRSQISEAVCVWKTNCTALDPKNTKRLLQQSFFQPWNPKR